MASAYLLLCADGTLYAGSTPDMDRRLHEHNYTKSAAKYTRGRRPVTIAYREDFDTIAEAREREREFKKLTRADKLALVREWRKDE
jgi:putative endonuclease